MPRLPESCVIRHDTYLEFRFPDVTEQKFRMYLSLKDAGTMSWKFPDGPSNRALWFDLLGIPGGKVHNLLQTHTRKVLSAHAGTLQYPPIEEGDGILHPSSRGFLSVTVADCMPIYILEVRSGSFGLLHSGWKGTGILKNSIKKLFDQGSRPEDIFLLFGPSIGSCCYAVDEERYRLFAELWGNDAVRNDGSRLYLSLLHANASIAESLGVGNWYSFNECTRCSGQYGSFRREGSEKFTTMLALSGYLQ